MNRRESLKSLLVGAAGVTLVTNGCAPGQEELIEQPKANGLYGRTPEELEHDQKIFDSEPFFNEMELGTLAALCDIILPPTPTAGGANDAEVPAFIEFIVKDLPRQQLPMQGGIMWLNGESVKRFTRPFTECTSEQQIAIIDDIAYPDTEKKTPQFEPGRIFFTRMRNLTLTGYYTTRIGIDDLGYAGNIPNTWDGVPADVLKDHGIEEDKEWNAKCVDQTTRHIQAEWDENGNLLT